MLLKNRFLTLLLALIGVTGVYSTASAQMTEALYKKACQVDRDNCHHLRVWGIRELKEPTQAHLSLFKSYKTEFLEAARLSGVNPRAVLGAIFGENVLNVDVLDYQVENAAKKNPNLCPNGVCAGGKTISFGLGGIQCQAAQAVEGLAAQLYSRPRRDNATVCTQVMNSQKESIRYAAAIMRDAQDKYAGPPLRIDVSKNIGVVVTLFNIGKIEQRIATLQARQRQDPSAQPRANFFGIFVEAYMDDIEEILGLGPMPPQLELLSTIREIEIKSRPDCVNFNPILGVRRAAVEASDMSVQRISGTVEVLGQTQCPSGNNKLVLVNGEKIGWINDANLKAQTQKKSFDASELNCRPQDSRNSTKLLERYPRNFTQHLGQQRLWEVSLPLPTGYSTSDFYTGISQNKKAELRANSNFSYSLCEANINTDRLSMINANQAQALIAQVRQTIQTRARGGSITWSDFTPFEDLFYCGAGCLAHAQTGASVFKNQIDSNIVRAQEIQRTCNVTPEQVDFREFLTFAKNLSLNSTITAQDVDRICSANTAITTRANQLIGETVQNIQQGACRYSVKSALEFMSEILKNPAVETVLVSHYPTYSFLKAAFPQVVLAQNIAIGSARVKPDVFYVQFKQSCSRR